MMLSIFLALIWAYGCCWVISFIRNYNAAKALNIPIIISPFNVLHPIFSLFGPLIQPIVFLLPIRLRRWSTFTSINWPFTDKRHIHREVGDVFALVNPWNFAIIIADPTSVNDILHRRKDFIKGNNFAIFNLFGKNLFSADGEDWSRQRKITAPVFNERVSNSVWEESSCQALVMLQHWKSSADGIVHSMLDDTRMIALHVLSAVGFGERHKFGPAGMTDVKPGHTMAYRDAVTGVLSHFVYLLVFPKKILDLPCVPKSMTDARLFMKEFASYMDEMLDDERGAIENGEAASTNQNLLSAMIRSSSEERDLKNRLTDDEIKGNLFIFTVAGHDTTAHTLAYAIVLLSLKQDCQSWLREELDQFIERKEHPKYEVFSKLVRCQAIMWESLRLYGPVLTAPRLTNGPQYLPLAGGKSIFIPAGTTLHLNNYGTHINPSAWSNEGSDPLEFRPQRWISPEPSGETLIHPQPGSFLAWSAGPRVCIGQKFSQVEFVAAISTIFSRHVVEPAGSPEKLQAVLNVANPQSPILSMVKSEDVAFRLREIKGDGGKEKN